MRSLEEVLKELNEDILHCDSLHRFTIKQNQGFIIYFWIKEIARFNSLGDTVEFLESLINSIKALEDYY